MIPSMRITASEAAARLGVKRETLYAYVSRGMLASERAPDGKTSTFDPAEVDAIRNRRHRRREGEVGTVVASGVARVADGSLAYRGRDVPALVAAGTGFEAVAELLWRVAGSGADGGAPGPGSAEGLPPRPWRAEPELLAAVAAVRDASPPGIPAIDRLRVAAAVASGLDPLRHDRRPPAVARAGRRLLSAYVEALPLEGRPRRGAVADRLWPRLTTSRPHAERVAVLDAALVLLADHDLAPSTFAARVAASTRADPYSVVVAGLGALGGPLHGAASAAVHDLLARAEATGSAAGAVGELLSRDRPLPGFGHAVYRTSDPRQVVLAEAVRRAYAGDPRLAVVEEVTDVARAGRDELPNVDLALGGLTFLARMAPGAGEVVFAVARTAGWLAHALEEYRESPLRFRPRSRAL